MRYPDVKYSFKTQYEFWDKVIRFIQYDVDELPILPERCHAFYVQALSSSHDNPFKYSAMEAISKEMEKQFGEPMTYTNIRNYKSRCKKLGWLDPRGNFLPFIQRLRETHRKEMVNGQGSFSLIMQITCS